MKRIFNTILLVFLSTMLYSSDISQFNITSGSVIDINGTVFIQKPELNKKIKLLKGAKIEAGDKVLTGFNGFITLKVEDVTVDVDPLSIIILNSAVYHNGRFRNIWTLEKGTIHVVFNSANYISPRLIFNTTENAIFVSGTEFYLNEKGLVTVIKGQVEVFLLKDWTEYKILEETLPDTFQKVHEGTIGGTKLPQYIINPIDKNNTNNPPNVPSKEIPNIPSQNQPAILPNDEEKYILED